MKTPMHQTPVLALLLGMIGILFASCASLEPSGKRTSVQDLDRANVSSWGLTAIQLSSAIPEARMLYSGEARGGGSTSTGVGQQVGGLGFALPGFVQTKDKSQYIPAGDPNTLYRDAGGVFLPFYRIETFPKSQESLSYGFILQRPENTLVTPHYVYVRFKDGAYSFGPITTTTEDGNGAKLLSTATRQVPTPDLRYAVAGYKLWAHPGQETIPLTETMFPGLTSTIDGRRVNPLGKPLPLIVLRQSTVNQTEVFEAISLDPPLYLGRVRSLSGSGVLKILLLGFDTQDQLREHLTIKTDSNGFDLQTGLGPSGWFADGQHLDGRKFDGSIDARGRQGYGRTRYDVEGNDTATAEKSEVEVGYYIDDALDGLAATYRGKSMVGLGMYRAGIRHGPYFVVGPDQTVVSQDLYRDGLFVNDFPYKGQSWWAGYWLGGESDSDRDGSKIPIAVSYDLKTRLVAWKSQPDGEYVEVLTPKGAFKGRVQSGGTTQGQFVFANGTIFDGPVQAWLPQGQGVLFFSDGTRLEIPFVQGEPAGTGWLVLGTERVQVEVVQGKTKNQRLQSLLSTAGATLNQADYARFYEQQTSAYLSEVKNVLSAHQERVDAETAAAVFGMLDSFQREVARTQGDSEALQLMRDITKSDAFEDIKKSLYAQGQGTDTLKSYEFQRALDLGIRDGQWRTLKNYVVSNLASDPKYKDLAQFIDTAATALIDAEEASRQQAQRLAREQAAIRAQSAQVRANGGAAIATSGGLMRPGSPKQDAWQGRRPRVQESDVQLWSVVQAADEYYRLYQSLWRSGKDSEADRVYQAHQQAVQRSREIESIGRDGGF